MSESGIDQTIYSKNVVEFVTVGSEYCATIENSARYTPQENLERLQKILPLLYLKATVLPKVERTIEDELEKFVSELDYNTMLQKWMQLLNENDSYYEVFDPNIQFGEETVTASISENLIDIYQDLKDFLTAYSIGNEDVMNDALAECILHFEDFWGQQLVNVLRAVHKLIVSNTDLSGDNNNNEEVAPGKGNPEWLDKFWGTSEEQD